ncbi:class I SAM-dependent methyltransferase [Cryptosporangium phraense]|uniref:Methyltransferase domain-containing protein n=1 Tax=Cryptosporangium phraense TaxID=2593070 RepID=A0A545AZ35_9ACTN|nr:methyltransferase domain-containing protein [Cryptosporangium phraense]TQS46593.1 methyltransferase domain-containing protein [Cryptosporangium phraense]
MQTWEASMSDRGSEASYGRDLLELLAALPGERVLDLGCGTGDHVALLRSRRVAADGVDQSPSRIARAEEKYPDYPYFSVADARALNVEAYYDAVFSNAVLHWIPEPAAVVASVASALRPGGRFVAEFGGAGNVRTIVDAAQDVREEFGLPRAPVPWFYPTVGEYATVVEGAELEVRSAWLFDRPTVLDGTEGLANWLRMHAEFLLEGVDAEKFVGELEDRVRDRLWRNGAWWADYRRIRVVAVKG